MPYLILDLEMSGSEADFHDIIQIGCILADDNWNKLSEFESLVYPDNPDAFSSDAENIHGISLNDLENAPIAYDVFENFEHWIRKTLKRNNNQPLHDIIFCGQSVINDINFLKSEYDELNITWPFSTKMYDLLSISFIFFQIFEANKIEKPKSMSLKNVAEYFNLKREEETHNALEDALLTYKCFKEYLNLMSSLKLVQ